MKLHPRLHPIFEYHSFACSHVHFSFIIDVLVIILVTYIIRKIFFGVEVFNIDVRCGDSKLAAYDGNNSASDKLGTVIGTSYLARKARKKVVKASEVTFFKLCVKLTTIVVLIS